MSLFELVDSLNKGHPPSLAWLTRENERAALLGRKDPMRHLWDECVDADVMLLVLDYAPKWYSAVISADAQWADANEPLWFGDIQDDVGTWPRIHLEDERNYQHNLPDPGRVEALKRALPVPPLLCEVLDGWAAQRAA